MRIKAIITALAVLGIASGLFGQRPGQAPSPAPQQQQQQQQPTIQEQTQQGNQTPQMGSQVTTNQKMKKPEGPVPLSEKDVTKEIKSSEAATVIKDVKDRGVDFDMTPEIEKKLRKAKATDEVIQAVKEAGPKARAQSAKLQMGSGGGAQNIPKEQATAYSALKTELDPDKAIAECDDFAKKYPDSPVLTYVYSFEANAYQQKGDLEKVVDYADKSLKLNGDNPMSLVLSIGIMPQPQYLNNHKAEQEKILQDTQTRANHALELIAKLPKLPTESDEDYQKRLGEIGSQVHGSLGMFHLEMANQSLSGLDKTELGKAEEEFNAAVSKTAHPDPRDYYRLGETYKMDGKIDDAIQAFTRAGELGQGTLIKTYSDQQVAELKKLKAAH
jgi:tetratricopeptide (TPR) repeat protein